MAGIRWRRLGGGVGSGDGSGGDVWAVASRQWRRLWRWSGQRRCSGSGVTAASLGRWGRLGGCVRSARTAGRESAWVVASARESAWVVASSGAVAVIGEDRGWGVRGTSGGHGTGGEGRRRGGWRGRRRGGWRGRRRLARWRRSVAQAAHEGRRWKCVQTSSFPRSVPQKEGNRDETRRICPPKGRRIVTKPQATRGSRNFGFGKSARFGSKSRTG